MAQLIESLAITGSRKSDGSANSSGKLWAFIPGTRTPITLYADYDALAPLTQPVTLNAAGKATAYLTGRADLLIEDSTGAAVDNFTYGNRDALVEVVNDGFTGTLPSGSQGAGGITDLNTVLLALATSAGLDNGALDGNFRGIYGTVAVPVWREIEAIWINAKRFGAVGNGVNDDTTNIQAALNAASAQGGGTVYLPTGTYKISATLTQAANVNFKGAGVGATILKNTNATGSAVQITGIYTITSDMTISHSSSSTSYAAGSTVTSVGVMRFKNLTITGHRTSVAGQGASGGLYVEDCNLTTTSADAASRGIVFAGNGDVSLVRNCIIAAASGYGIEWTESFGTQIGVIMGNTITGARGISLTTVAHAFIAGNKSALYTAADCTGVVEIGNSMVVTHNDAVGNFFSSAKIRPITGYSYSVDVAAAGSHTPDAGRAHHVRIRATSAGTITVNPPNSLTFIDGHELLITFYNNSGGAVVWTLNAAYHVVAAPAPANGSKTLIRFVYDLALGTWNQSGGSSTVVA